MLVVAAGCGRRESITIPAEHWVSVHGPVAAVVQRDDSDPCGYQLCFYKGGKQQKALSLQSTGVARDDLIFGIAVSPDGANVLVHWLDKRRAATSYREALTVNRLDITDASARVIETVHGEILNVSDGTPNVWSDDSSSWLTVGSGTSAYRLHRNKRATVLARVPPDGAALQNADARPWLSSNGQAAYFVRNGDSVYRATAVGESLVWRLAPDEHPARLVGRGDVLYVVGGGLLQRVDLVSKQSQTKPVTGRVWEKAWKRTIPLSTGRLLLQAEGMLLVVDWDSLRVQRVKVPADVSWVGGDGDYIWWTWSDAHSDWYRLGWEQAD